MVSHCFYLNFSGDYDVEHFFIALVAFFMSSFEKCLYESLAHFLNQLLVFCIELQEFFMYFGG